MKLMLPKSKSPWLLLMLGTAPKTGSQEEVGLAVAAGYAYFGIDPQT